MSQLTTPAISERAFLLRLGAIAAIVGTILQVIAGSTSGTWPVGQAEAALTFINGERPGWVWPVIYLGFICGALCWVGALVTLAATLTEGVARALSLLAVASIIVGVTLHAVDGALNGVSLGGLAREWAAAPEGERAALLLVQDGNVLLRLLNATWAAVIIFFHGVPFVLAGLAVSLSRRHPAWLGWIGFIGGAGSVVIGVWMFLGAETRLAVPFAVVISAFMLVLGGSMWMQAGETGEPVSS
jgi:hypothetical protein